MAVRTGLTRQGRLRRARCAAATTLAWYGLAGARLTLINESENTVYRVDTSAARGAGGERYVLRIQNPENYGAATAGSELAWLMALRRETALAVPEPIATCDGALMVDVQVDEDDEPRHAVLFRWIEGRHAGSRLTPSMLGNVGRFMGRLHRHGEGFIHAPEITWARWDWERLFGAASVLGPGGERFFTPQELAVFSGVGQRVREAMEYLDRAEGNSGLIHSDLHQANYLFHRCEVRAIDFESCGRGYFLFDIAVTLASLQKRQDYPALRIAFLDGYAREHSLPARLDEMIDIFIAARVVDLVDWIASSPDLQVDSWGRSYLARSVELLRPLVP